MSGTIKPVPGQGQWQPSREAGEPAALDWPRIDAWTADVVRGDCRSIAAVFEAAGVDAPLLLWDPPCDAGAAAPIQFVLDHWRALGGGERVPEAAAIEPDQLKPALGYLMLLDPVDYSRDFRYRLYGTKIARISNFDMTGRLLSSFPSSAYATEFAIATYRAVLIRNAPLYTVRRPAMGEFTSYWQRLALPLADKNGAMLRVLGCTVAIDTEGRMVEVV